MTSIWTPPARFLRWLYVLPPKVRRGRWWSYVWRGLIALATVALLLLGAALGIPFLMVSAPDLIVEGTAGDQCRSGGSLDCQRAIADARQAILLALGGVIATIGLVVTVRRWQLERVADTRAQSAHERETSQAARATVVDAISLLDSDSAPKRTAAVAILREHAVVPENVKDVPMILDVLAAHVRRPTPLSKRKRTRSGRVAVVSKAKNRFATSSTQAIKTALELSVLTGHRVDFAGIVIRGLIAPNSDWRFAEIDGVRFEDGDLSDAVFSSVSDARRRVRGVEFVGTKLTRACFDNAELLDVNFEAAEPEAVPHGRLRVHTLQSVQGASFAGTYLSAVVFNTSLTRVKFDRAKLRNVVFDGQILRDVSFLSGDLHGVRFEDVAFTGRCSFEDAELRRVRVWRKRESLTGDFELRAPDEAEFESEEGYRAMATLPGLDALRLVKWRGMTFVERRRGDDAPGGNVPEQKSTSESSELPAATTRDITLFD